MSCLEITPKMFLICGEQQPPRRHQYNLEVPRLLEGMNKCVMLYNISVPTTPPWVLRYFPNSLPV